MPSKTRKRARLEEKGRIKEQQVEQGIQVKEVTIDSLDHKKIAQYAETRAEIGSEHLRQEEDQDQEEEEEQDKPKRKVKRKMKVKPTVPNFPRAQGLAMVVGSHTAASGGVPKAIENAVQIGANAFALFLRNQKRWAAPPLPQEQINEFQKLIHEHGYDPRRHIIPHASYLFNSANPDKAKADCSYQGMLDELRRCEALNIGNYNIHPGSTCGGDKTAALKQLAGYLNQGIAETSNVRILLENMAGHGNIIGSSFEDLGQLIDQIQDKSRIGVCFDTCHAFAAGYDLRTQETYEETWKKFDEIIGRKYLYAIHMNDSKGPFKSHRDLHQNIGQGFLGLEAFRLIMNDKRLEGLPLILETPVEESDEVPRGTEIKLLEWLIGKHEENAEFLDKKRELSDKGSAERKKHMDAYDRKMLKNKDKLEKQRIRENKRAAKSAKRSSGDEDD